MVGRGGGLFMNADAIATIQPETVSQGLVRRLLEIKWALLAMVGQATEQCAGQRAQHDAERCCQHARSQCHRAFEHRLPVVTNSDTDRGDGANDLQDRS